MPDVGAVPFANNEGIAGCMAHEPVRSALVAILGTS